MSDFSESKSSEFLEATRLGDLHVVRSLFSDSEVDLNICSQGNNPFLNACSHGHVAVVSHLLQFPGTRIDYNSRDLQGRSAFFLACQHRKDRVVQLLLADRRINVNQGNFSDETPLWRAAADGRVDVVRYILASNWDIDVETRDFMENRTAAHVARESGPGGNVIADLIEEYGINRRKVRGKLRRELGYDVVDAGELFALVVYYSDGYFLPSSSFSSSSSSNNNNNFNNFNKNARRFFSLAAQLPLELQMVLCNRVFDVLDSNIKSQVAELGFKKFARDS